MRKRIIFEEVRRVGPGDRIELGEFWGYPAHDEKAIAEALHGWTVDREYVIYSRREEAL